jgi:hypothetical protein
MFWPVLYPLVETALVFGGWHTVSLGRIFEYGGRKTIGLFPSFVFETSPDTQLA